MTTPWGRTPAIQINADTFANVFMDLRRAWKRIEGSFTTDVVRVKGNPRPELLSEQIYGRPDYWWLILVINDVVDPFNGWIKDEDQMMRWLSQRYEDPNDVAFYEAVDGSNRKYYDVVQIGSSWYDAGDPGAIQPPIFTGPLLPVTYAEYEARLNDSARLMTFVISRQVGECEERIMSEVTRDVI